MDKHVDPPLIPAEARSETEDELRDAILAYRTEVARLKTIGLNQYGEPAEVLETPDEQVTRFEVIDESGRRFTRWKCKIERSYQDQGRTLKVFVVGRDSPEILSALPDAARETPYVKAREQAVAFARSVVTPLYTGMETPTTYERGQLRHVQNHFLAGYEAAMRAQTSPALPAPDLAVTHIYEPDVYVGSPCKRCRLEPNHHSHAQKPLLVTDRAVTAPQAQESMPVIAAGLLTLLKEECEAQHTRAAKAESELKALRAALLVLVGEMVETAECWSPSSDASWRYALKSFAEKLQRLLEAEA